MPDVRIDVYADTHGAPKQLGDTEKALDGLEKGAGVANGTMGGLWKQFAIGQLAVAALKKAYDLLKGVVEDSIKNALAQEKADVALQAAIEITGRTVEGNLQHYKDVAAAQMKYTTYTDDEIEASQALLLQLTSLDQNGIDRATKGAMGLATTMGMDLHGATVMVTKAMEGNYTALGRVGIKVAENLTAEQKQASLLDQLDKLYQRSTAETDTFGGALKQLKNSWGEALETTGMAILKNEKAKEAIKNLKEWIDKVASSPEFQDFLKDAVAGLIKAAEFAGKFANAVITIYDKCITTNKAQRELNTTYDAFHKSIRLAIDGGRDYEAEMKAATEAAAKNKKAINETGTAVHGLTAEQIKAAAEAKKMSDELTKAAQNIIDRYMPLQAATRKLKDEEDTLTKARKAGLISIDAYDIAMAANAKAQRDVGVEAGKTTKAQSEMVTAAQNIINKYNPMHAAMVTAINDERILATALKAGVITDKAYAQGLEVINKDLKAAEAAEKAAKTTTSAFALSIQDLINKLKVTGPGFNTASAGEKQLMAALVMGMISLKQYKKLLEDLNKELKDKKGTSAWVENAKSAVAAVCAAANVGIAYIEGKNEQALQKKLTQLDTEYQAQLLLIQNSIMNEEEKATAIEALDATYAAKRKAAEVQAAEQRKKTAIAQAIINTAQGVALAWGQGGALFGAIMAAIVAAAGAVQIALIRSQPIGAAAGAIFKQKALLMSQASGQEYEVAEGGEAEIISSPSQLRQAIMGKGQGSKGSGRTISLTVPIYIGANLIKKEIITIVEEAGQLGRLRIAGKAVA